MTHAVLRKRPFGSNDPSTPKVAHGPNLGKPSPSFAGVGPNLAEYGPSLGPNRPNVVGFGPARRVGKLRSHLLSNSGKVFYDAGRTIWGRFGPEGA